MPYGINFETLGLGGTGESLLKRVHTMRSCRASALWAGVTPASPKDGSSGACGTRGATPPQGEASLCIHCQTTPLSRLKSPGALLLEALIDLLDHAKKEGYAIPAVNCWGTWCALLLWGWYCVLVLLWWARFWLRLVFRFFRWIRGLAFGLVGLKACMG